MNIKKDLYKITTRKIGHYGKDIGRFKNYNKKLSIEELRKLKKDCYEKGLLLRAKSPIGDLSFNF